MRPQCGSWLTVKSICNLQPLFPSPTPPVLPLKNVERKQHSLAYLEGNKDLKGCDDSCKESHWILVKSYPVNQQEGNWWGHHGGRRWWLGGSVVMQREILNYVSITWRWWSRVVFFLVSHFYGVFHQPLVLSELWIICCYFPWHHWEDITSLCLPYWSSCAQEQQD